ncbi:MAG: hypothetical protein KVP17_003602 [Porospora cf. gigantea B]|uniref:uncharacterized protein n=2 Tax=Porospora cf. gigantea B TaxID=2853592 RepID=UPI003571BA66|nr:MAG: hypothetical protein KVP17_003602 [Porospora cf. gigantea B]
MKQHILFLHINHICNFMLEDYAEQLYLASSAPLLAESLLNDVEDLDPSDFQREYLLDDFAMVEKLSVEAFRLGHLLIEKPSSQNALGCHLIALFLERMKRICFQLQVMAYKTKMNCVDDQEDVDEWLSRALEAVEKREWSPCAPLQDTINWKASIMDWVGDRNNAEMKAMHRHRERQASFKSDNETIDDEYGDEGWKTRGSTGERSTRIKTRRPTGHPNVMKENQHFLHEMAEDIRRSLSSGE